MSTTTHDSPRKNVNKALPSTPTTKPASQLLLLIITTIIITTLATPPLHAIEELPTDLGFYPHFLKEGTDLDVTIVVGEQATSLDVLAASEIAVGLQQAAPSSTLKRTQLDTAFNSVEGKRIISIGNSCENYVTALITGTSKCEAYFPEGKGIIELHELPKGGIGIVVGGMAPEDTYKAAVVLRQAQQYDLIGDAYEVTGNPPRYTVTPRSIPRLAEEDKILKRPEPREQNNTEDTTKKTPEQEEHIQKNTSTIPTEARPNQTQQPNTNVQQEKQINPPGTATTQEVTSTTHAKNLLIGLAAGIIVLIFLLVIIQATIKSRKKKETLPTSTPGTVPDTPPSAKTNGYTKRITTPANAPPTPKPQEQQTPPEPQEPPTPPQQ
ncbi:hypothetical protein D6783_02720 [Candidatus Woesearchaeota archaeon]|nr:MAG: hypothetical protein D6783_02720 [Candidatus Woesearchaeota archaeon]